MVDDFAWMRQVDDPELVAYLRAENDWAAQQTAHQEVLRAQIERELASALPDESLSAPRPRGRWEYRVHRPPGAQYPVHVRRQRSSAGPDAVVLDENQLAEGHDFCKLGVWAPSPDGTLLAYSVDHSGNEVYELRIRDLGTGLDLPDRLAGTYEGLAWAADGSCLLYTTLDEAHRPDTVRRHVLGRPQADDELVWRESDRRFELQITQLRSGAYALLLARSRDTTEARLVSSDDLTASPVLVAERAPGREYFVDHCPGPDGGSLLIVTDLEAPEFRVMTAPVSTPGPAHWEELLPHDPGVRVHQADALGGHVVVTERCAGSLRVRVLSPAGATVRLVTPGGPGEVVRLAEMHEQDVNAIRLVREGWIRSPVEVDHDLATGAETVVHEQPVLRSLQDIDCAVLHALADDGVAVPVSVIRSARAQPGPWPCLLYGYGAYESSLDPEFWPEMLPLIDRGVTLAVAHVRGGGELGRNWWQQGRLLRKRTTFTDFISCARHLVDSGLTAPGILAARGISAGGLLMGAVVHLAPEQFAAVVAEVPFVDVVTTMLDDSLPLTVAEWDEWGDPRNPEHFACLAGYSPFENTPGPRRPALLVTASRHDPRVLVHEPAKWVARMRAEDAEAGDPSTQRGESLLLLTALGEGAHTGPAGRYDAWRHEAFLHAFVLDRIHCAPASTAAEVAPDLAR